MRYLNNGIEIQYRECQIARNTAKDLDELKNKRKEWAARIREVPDRQILKQADCSTLANFISNMPQDYYDAMAEYVGTLLKKGRGIDIMVPYISTNGMLILTVNRHEKHEPGEY